MFVIIMFVIINKYNIGLQQFIQQLQKKIFFG